MSVKNDYEKVDDTEREPIVIDNGQTSKEKDVVEKYKEQPYIPPPTYKALIPYPT